MSDPLPRLLYRTLTGGAWVDDGRLTLEQRQCIDLADAVRAGGYVRVDAQARADADLGRVARDADCAFLHERGFSSTFAASASDGRISDARYAAISQAVAAAFRSPSPQSDLLTRSLGLLERAAPFTTGVFGLYEPARARALRNEIDTLLAEAKEAAPRA